MQKTNNFFLYRPILWPANTIFYNSYDYTNCFKNIVLLKICHFVREHYLKSEK